MSVGARRETASSAKGFAVSTGVPQGANVAEVPQRARCGQASCAWQQAYLNCHCHAGADPPQTPLAPVEMALPSSRSVALGNPAFSLIRSIGTPSGADNQSCADWPLIKDGREACQSL